MPKELERDLGLLAVVAISVGAMVGSGIFILPGLAMVEAGPAVVAAYLLAGVFVLPAALSKSEMATAMPEAGGTYIYIERGMGPLLGTIAGIGTWFSLSFKSALALVGGMPYLAVLFDIPQTTVALVLCLLLIVVNVGGVKQTGRMQIGIVAVMLVAMGWFVVQSAPATDAVRYQGFFAEGASGLLAATGLVFVSYAGVTKIASVAEEVENPGRNIPLGILGSLVFTTFLYVAIVAIVVGAVPGPELLDSYTPMTDVAELTMGNIGVVAIVLAAVLALLSTANAGILSSSRYPFAMSRDALAPAVFESVSERFNTPRNAITITGLLMLGLIAFVPILSIAKLASAFKILVFALVNAALIAFREADLEEYDPAFESPFYPWTQLFGIGASGLLLTQMGLVPFAGAVGMVLVGLVWYALFARSRIDREGAAADVVRRSLGQNVLERTQAELDTTSGYKVLVAMPADADRRRERRLLVAATAAAAGHNGSVYVVQFEEVPDQVPLDHASSVRLDIDEDFEARTADLATEFDVDIVAAEVVSHDAKHAIVNHARREGSDLLLLERHSSLLRSTLPSSELDWLVRHAPCDVLLMDGEGGTEIRDVAVVADRGTYDPAKVRFADDVAAASGGTVHLLYEVAESTTPGRRQTVEEYLAELASSCRSPVETLIRSPSDPGRPVTERADEMDLVVVGPRRSSWRRRLFGWPDSTLVGRRDALVIEVHVRDGDRPGLLRRLAERAFF
jgi:amino acid transporter/nucleotide-binding universal stress UspA family protein